MSSKTQKQSNFSNIIFVTALAVITIFLAVFMFIMIGKPFVVKEYSDIKQLTVENYKTYDKKHTEYYVIVYNRNSEKDSEIKDIVIEYANYARTNSDALPIYAIDYVKNNGIADSSNLNISSSNLDTKLPALIRIKNGSVSSSDTKNTISTIKQELVSAMGK
ncbi:MAG: hypothetical protein PUH11_01155 [Bacilli bacterium]|nr:hypothetical protein [Bacilli bacterium]